jgi:hypothetical protein
LFEQSGWCKNLIKQVVVKRKYNGDYIFEYVNNKRDTIAKVCISDLLNKLIQTCNFSDLPDKEIIIEFVNSELKTISTRSGDLVKDDIVEIETNFKTF